MERNFDSVPKTLQYSTLDRMIINKLNYKDYTSETTKNF